jgi:hypothetical protein
VPKRYNITFEKGIPAGQGKSIVKVGTKKPPHFYDGKIAGRIISRSSQQFGQLFLLEKTGPKSLQFHVLGETLKKSPVGAVRDVLRVVPRKNCQRSILG